MFDASHGRSRAVNAFIRFSFLCALAAARTADAHNLDANAVYTYFDPDTRALLDARIAGGWTPGTPLLQNGDEIGLIIKAIPDNGTSTGVGGFVTFYLPNGVQLEDVAYVQPGSNPSDGISGYDKVPVKGQALMPNVGAGGGPTVSLVGISRGPNIAGVTATLVNGANVNNGTLPGVYGDLGIFYSTAPETAYGTYSGGTLRNNSGDTVGSRTTIGVPLNVWDTWQLAGYGISGTTNPTYPTSPLLDSNGRGNTGWGLASPVAGPQSGYAWEFNLPDYQSCDPIPYAPTTACLNAATSTVGPWNRIQYPGSQIGYDVPGDTTAGYFNGGLDASGVGYDLSSAPLPATTGQSNGTPNAVRWAIGQLTLYTPEFVWLKVKINDYTSMLDASGCPIFNLDTFGGDAGGDSFGKDHIWRYYDPNSVHWNGCLAVGKPATRDAVQVGETFQYNLKVYNTGSITLSNVVISDALPAGVAFVSAAPSQSSGPNPLVWNIGSLAPGQSYASVVTVKASSSGELINTVHVTGNPPTGPPTSSDAQERTTAGLNVPLLRQSKSVSPSSVVAPGSVQYTILIENIGSGSTGNPVKITENLPTGFTYQSLVSATANGASVTGLVSVNNSDPTTPVFTVPVAVQASKSLSIVFNAAVAAGTPSGSYCNSYVTNQNGVNISTGSIACVNVGGGSIGDTVYRDWDGDGTQDAGDEGLSGVTLSLYGGSCPPSGPVLATRTTNASGFYQFTGLGAGTYCVDAPSPGSGGLPGGYSLTTANDPQTITIATNETRSDADFGYLPGGTGSIGDQVFDDVNADGVFNGSDAGIPSVTVRLYEDTGGNGTIDSGDTLIATTSTNGSGIYSFAGLATGISYIVDVDQSDPDIASYYVSNYGSSSGVTQTTSDPHAVSALAGSNTSADFGFYKIVPGSIGDDVFLDIDGDGTRDPGEDGIANVTVNLYQDTDGDGTLDVGEPLLDTTSTDSDGKYSFGNLPAGNYIVVLDASDPDIPAEYVPVDDTLAATLTTAQTRTDIDFPLVALLYKTVDKTFDDPTVLPNTLTYTIAPRYPGGSQLASVLVTDNVPAGSTFLSNPPTSPSANGVAVDDDEPVDGIIDHVEWDLGGNSPPANGFTGGTPPPACQTTLNVVADTDTWIDGANVATNHGTAATVDTANAANDKVGLLHFNISASTLPAGSTLGAISISLTPDNGAGTNRQIELHELSTSYTEGTTANGACTAAGNGAAWQGPNCTDDWQSAGGNFGTTDYSATNLSTFNPTTNDSTITQNSASLTSLVTAWLTGGTNHGLAMVPVGSATNTVNWHARADATAGFRPTISITYTPNGCTGTTVIRDTGAGEVPDSYIQEDSGGNDNFGTSTTLRSRFEATKNKHLLIKWDLASIPASATILSASMKATVTAKQGTAKVQVHRMTHDWVEGTTAVNGVQWNDPNGTGTAGTWTSGVFSATDYDASNLGTINADTNGAKTVGVTALVQGWYDSTFVNDGVVLLATAKNADVVWASSENATVANRPTLTVNWSLDPAGSAGTSSMSAAWTIAQAGDSFPVTMRLTNDGASPVTNVAPGTIAVSATGSSTASCTGPSPATATVPAAGFVEFTWDCTVTAADSNPDELTFTASASNGTTTWSAATSNGVIVSPVLQFQVNVKNPPGVNVVDNAAQLSDGATLLSTSNTVHTAVTASIGDFVWNDVDADGVQDPGEAGIPSVRVFLDADNDGVFDVGEVNATTDSAGAYLFTGLAIGTYSVVLDQTTLPAGWHSTTPSVLSETISSGGQQITTADFGATLTSGPTAGSIGDTVWIDADEDGVFDAGESALPNVTVKLWRDANTNGVLDGGDFVADTTTTDASGNYLFDNLNPAAWLVVVDTSSAVTTPYGVPTTIGAAMDLVSGVNPKPVTLASGQDFLTADFGFNWGGSIGDFGWYDKDGDGVQDGPAFGCNNANPAHECGAPNMTAVLFYDLNASGDVDPGDPILTIAVTDAAGHYLFDNLPPGNYLVQSSEQEVPAPASSAHAGESGRMVHSTAEDVAVVLAPNQDVTTVDFGFIEAGKVEGHLFHDADRNGIFDPSETPLGGITVHLDGTDSNNNPVHLSTVTDAGGEYDFTPSPGDYTISYDPAAPPIPTNLTDPTTPLTYDVTVAAGQEVGPLDFGLDDGGKIGDYVWVDADADGIQDAGESGLSGVTVILWLDPNGDGNLGDASLVDVQATGATGDYLFVGLPGNTGPARYVVQVDTSSLPSGFSESGDPDEAGACVVCNSQSIVNLASGASNLTRDFGYHAALSRSISGTVFSDDGSGGGTALNGIQDGTEAGVGPNVKVTAHVDTDNDNTFDFDLTTTTDGGGSYSFLGVPNGSRVVLAVDESTLSDPTLVRTNDVDGGADASITIANLSANVSDRDFGYISTPGSISGTVCTGSGDGLCDDAGETPGLSGVTITLVYGGSDNALGTADDTTATLTTDASGNYSFTAATIGSGNCSPLPCAIDAGLPAGLYQITRGNVPGSSGLADADGGNPDVITVSLAVGENRTTRDFELGGLQANLSISKDDGSAVYVPGGTLTYTITVSNLGPADVTGASVTDSFPAELNNVTWTCSGSGGGSCTASGNGDISDSVDLPLGASVTYHANADVIAGATVNPLVNSASVATPPGVTDPTPANNTDDDQDAPTAAPSSIGDRLWLDEDGDGVQDAGEDGIAGVTVQLYDSTGTTLITATSTDTDGRYIFTNQPAGTYQVRVDTTTMPAGLAANRTYDLDGTGTANRANVTVAAGVFEDGVDFGYNWVAATTSTNPAPGATGAIGDRIWNDADQDGIQDFGEAGIPNVTVRLLTDDNGDGVYGGAGDNAPVTTTTGASGHYIFDGIAPGAYVIDVLTATLPAGYSTTPTGDPDSDGNSATNPIVLAPGDVFVSADFGYPLPAGHDIGNTIFVDASADGVQDPGEPGIAGVTVVLLDNLGHIVASTTTDAGGNYLFPGLPDGTYTVVVTDSANVLADVSTNTADPDGGFDRLSTIALAGADELTQDFGFAPAGQDPGDGLIGDTIFLDRNTNGVADPGEGMQGVTVNLYASDGTTLLASVVTDINGQYVFGGLDPGDTFVVKVDHATLPNGGTGFVNSVDPDGGLDEEATVDLTSFQGGVTYDQDFAYEADNANSIGGTVFDDVNGNGTKSAGETSGYAGITVILRDQDGNVVGTTTTDAFGNYQFDQLPDGTYTVEVSEAGNVLGGLTKSNGPSPGADDNSQVAGYSVTVAGGATDTTGDFGYFAPGAALGNFVFSDDDGDGIQDAGEPGLAGVVLTLTITYPNGDVTTVVTTSDASGAYSFGNLLLDEQFDGVGGGEPTYSISVDTPTGYLTSPVAQGADPQADSNDPSGDAATVSQGVRNTSDDALASNGHDFGFIPATDVSISKSGPGGVTPGFDVVYTIIVTNNGSIAADNVTVTDPTPSGLSFVSNSSNPVGLCTTAFPCNLGTLAPGASVTITSTFSVPGGYTTPDPIVNTATVSTDTPDTDPGNDSDDAQTTLTNAQADVKVEKSGPASATPGGNVAFTIKVTNDGPSDADNVILTDPTPGGLTFVSAPPCGATLATGCNLGTIASGSFVTVTATYAVPSSYTSPDPIHNTAVVSSDANDPTPANNTDDADVPLDLDADLEVTKDGPATVTPGGNAVYTVTVKNNGPSDAAGVVLADPTPTNLSFVSATAPCGSGFPCNLGSLAANASTVITVTYSVPGAYTTPDPVVNTATASSSTPDSDPSNDSDSASSPVSQAANLTITKSDAGSGVDRNSDFSYTIQVSNAGPANATNVTVVDTLDSDTSYVSDTGGCVQAPAGTLTCNIGSITSGSSTSFNITVHVSGSAPFAGTRENGACNGTEDLCNSATVSADQTDLTPADNTDDEPTNVNAVDLSVDKTDSGNGVNLNEDFAYTITVGNAGPDAATNVVAIDTLDPATSYVSASVACVEAPAGTLTCPVGTIAANASTSFTVIVHTSGTAPTSGTLETGPCDGSEDLCNSVSVSAAQADSSPANNTDTEPTDVHAAATSADLSITKTDLSSPVQRGAFATYTISVTNSGPGTATSARVVDTLDPNATYFSATAPCSEAPPGLLTCQLGDLASGASVSFDVVVHVENTAPTASPLQGVACTGAEDMCNRASVSSLSTDPDPSDNVADVATNVVPTTTTAALTLTKSDLAAEPVQPGTNVTYQVSVLNAGPDTATDVVVYDTLDPFMTYVSDTGGCTPSSVGGTTVLTCPLGSVPTGPPTVFTVVVTIAANAPVSSTLEDGDCTGSEDICNDATVTSSAADPAVADNHDSEPTDVSALATCNNGSLDPGEQCDPVSAEICNNGIDDDGNNAADCGDPACQVPGYQSCDGNCQLSPACIPILNDPATLTWSRLHIHGRIIPTTPADPVAEPVTIALWNANGLIYSGTLFPGDMRLRNPKKRLPRWVFRDQAARSSRGIRNGIYRIGIHNRDERIGGKGFVFTITVYSDMSAATLSTMTTLIYIGDDVGYLTEDWDGGPGHWHIHIPNLTFH